jgi:hypothetical protein
MLAVKETYGPSPMSRTSSVNLTGSLLNWPLFFVVFIGNLWRGLRMSCSLPYDPLLSGEIDVCPPSVCIATLACVVIDHGIASQPPTVPCAVRSPLFHLLLDVS